MNQRRGKAAAPRKKGGATGSLDDLIGRIAGYYGGKPLRVEYMPDDGLLGYTYPDADFIGLSPKARKSLEALVANPRSDAGRRAGMVGLGTLIHEALHTRGPDGKGTRQPNGFFTWDDEWQARQLSYNLVPDAMQRFFGIDANSPLGRKYEDAARGYGFTQSFGPPPPSYGGPSRVTRW